MVVSRAGWGLVMGLALVAAIAWLALRPAGRVTIGSALTNGTSDATLRVDEPFRALLTLDRPLAAAGRVHVEVRRMDDDGERVERDYTARAGKGNDELFIAFPSTGRVVSSPGTFRVVFLLDGRALGTAWLRVVR